MLLLSRAATSAGDTKNHSSEGSENKVSSPREMNWSLPQGYVDPLGMLITLNNPDKPFE